MSTAQWKEDNVDKIRQYRRTWYNKNKDHARGEVTRRKKEIGQWFREYKKTLKCKYCNENCWACLDFHHRDQATKDFEVTRVVNGGWSKKRILEEIDKCDIVCSNCHRKIHHLGSALGASDTPNVAS